MGKFEMNVEDLIKKLKKFKGHKVLVSSDEELNVLYSGIGVSSIQAPKKTIVIFGLDGTEEN